MHRVLKTPALLVFALVAANPGAALTVEQQVTPEFLKAHPKELTLKVEKRDDGMLHFALRRTLTQAKYLVSRTVLKQDGKKIADVSTPTYGKKGENSFYVAVSTSQLAEAEYELSESFLAGPANDPVPLPGTVIYKFTLKDFVK